MKKCVALNYCMALTGEFYAKQAPSPYDPQLFSMRQAVNLARHGNPYTVDDERKEKRDEDEKGGIFMRLANTFSLNLQSGSR